MLTVYLARHGETAWSLTGQHTGRTDLSLTDRGERNAQRLGAKLTGIDFEMILCSPLQRAKRTCEIAGFGDRVESCDDLVEWDYGDYEGLRTVDIQRQHPDWQLFRDGCPHGESPAHVQTRADRVISQVQNKHRNVLIFSSGHFLRVLTARWLGQPPECGRLYALNTASLSILGYEHSNPVIRCWNDTNHVET